MISQPQARRRYAQLTLGTLLLTVTLVGALLGWFRTHRQASQLQQKVTSLRELARELRVDDPAQIFVVSRFPTLAGEYVFDFYIPPGDTAAPTHRLCLALEGILGSAGPNSDSSFPPPSDFVKIAPGRHAAEIRHQPADLRDPDSQHQVEILLDGEVVFQAVRPAVWHPSHSWSSSGGYAESKQFDPLKPAELHRRRFNEPIVNGSRSVDDDKPANGILLWIEPL